MKPFISILKTRLLFLDGEQCISLEFGSIKQIPISNIFIRLTCPVAFLLFWKHFIDLKVVLLLTISHGIAETRKGYMIVSLSKVVRISCTQ
nr:AlNc14C806G12532 [Albugo laibachii Nc14]|eukprot:CCA27902.1 AlNc14C806G12532 [Albugo laibachii Nc14]